MRYQIASEVKKNVASAMKLYATAGDLRYLVTENGVVTTVAMFDGEIPVYEAYRNVPDILWDTLALMSDDPEISQSDMLEKITLAVTPDEFEY